MSTPAGWVERAVAVFTSTDSRMRPGISHYCQKCLAANPLGQEFCARCGTRLMIVVEPSSARFEAGPASLSTDEHLLERISAAENRSEEHTSELQPPYVISYA